MKKTKINSTKILSLLGALLWISAIFLRETQLVSIPSINFLLGIAPNAGAALAIALIFENLYVSVFKKDFTSKLTLLSLILIFVLGLASELIHDLFLNSPFDIYDIIATGISLLIYSLFSFIHYRKLNSSNKTINDN